MKPLFLLVASLQAATTLTAGTVSYVALQDSDRDSLVRISADGKTVTSIANGAAGVGLAVDGSGNYIVAAKSKLLRVTRDGKVSTIADAPANSEWRAVAVGQNGEIAAADCKQTALWLVSPDGSSVRKLADFNGDPDCGGYGDVALAVEGSGDYLVLARGDWPETRSDRRKTHVRLTRITPGGEAVEIRITGLPVTEPGVRWPRALVPDGREGFLFVHAAVPAVPPVWSLAPDGAAAPLSLLGGEPDPAALTGLARNPETGDLLLAGFGGRFWTVTGGSSVARLPVLPAIGGPGAAAVVADPGASGQ